MTSTVADASTVHSTADRPRSGRWRRIGAWLSLVVLVIGAAFVLVQATGATSVVPRPGADPESTGPNGTLALAEIVRDRGVEVQVVRSHTAAQAAITDDTTLVMTDPYPLTDEAVLDLIGPANRVVFLSASSRILRLLDLGESYGTASAMLTPSCDVPELRKVGDIRPISLFEPGDAVSGCFSEDGGSALLVAERDGATTALIDADDIFSNRYLDENGNAALGLALLAQTDHVVWYVPSFADSDIEGSAPPSLGELTPGWATPAICLLLLAAVAAAIWRGRRFGPLVAETLPVTVRASETMHGRARMTAKAADSQHAGSAIRVGSVRRMAKRLGLAERASSTEVADAAADRLRIPRAGVTELLTGPLPDDDARLIAEARALSELESAIDTAVRTERNTP